MEIREFREEDEKGIRDLFYLCFGREMSHEEWEWKYRKSPWSSKGYVAVDDGKVVAFYGGIRLSFSFYDKRLWAYQFCDVMTHPKYRGRLFSKTPLLVKMGELFYKENPMDIAFGFPSLRHARLQNLSFKGEGYRFVRLYKKERLKRHIFYWKSRVKEGWELLEDKDIENILIWHYNTPVKLNKNKEYIRWRYIENPVKTYQMLVFERSRVKKGCIVCAFKDGWMNILEIFLRNYRDIKDILISLEDYVLKKNIVGIKTWLHPNEPLARHFGALGYSSEDGIPLIAKQINKECGITTGIFYEKYFYRMGDYDDS